MHGPVLLSWLLAALTAAAGGHCLARLRRSPCTAHAADRPAAASRHAYESDAAEALMGFGMAAMAVSGSTVPAAVWAWLFGAPAVAFLLAAAGGPARRAHRLHHAVGGLTMTYMALAMGAGSGHGHHHPAGAGTPLLTGALLFYFGGYSLWAGVRLLGAPATAAQGAAGLPTATAGLPRACRLSMGIGMFAMLLTM
ncbi:DUF5134 domain-containing protein [Kitasatospora sp. NPDC047058]|uniref:DUF5134 domain-containing protein n=1 Tax=Kitasatospora sp. NPDC047058 TaxID=3155620 RepID=UPI0033DEF348